MRKIPSVEFGDNLPDFKRARFLGWLVLDYAMLGPAMLGPVAPGPVVFASEVRDFNGVLISTVASGTKIPEPESSLGERARFLTELVYS